MKTILNVLFAFGIAFTALACGSDKTGTACTSSTQCGGGAGFCSNGFCQTSPGAEIGFEDEEEADTAEEAEAEAAPEDGQELE